MIEPETQDKATASRVVFQKTTTQAAIPKNTPKFIQEIADSVFGEKEFLPLTTFMSRTGMSRETVLHLVSAELLDVFEYRPTSYRKILIAKTSFIRFLKKTSLRIIN